MGRAVASLQKEWRGTESALACCDADEGVGRGRGGGGGSSLWTRGGRQSCLRSCDAVEDVRGADSECANLDRGGRGRQGPVRRLSGSGSEWAGTRGAGRVRTKNGQLSLRARRERRAARRSRARGPRRARGDAQYRRVRGRGRVVGCGGRGGEEGSFGLSRGRRGGSAGRELDPQGSANPTVTRVKRRASVVGDWAHNVGGERARRPTRREGNRREQGGRTYRAGLNSKGWGRC